MLLEEMWATYEAVVGDLKRPERRHLCTKADGAPNGVPQLFVEVVMEDGDNHNHHWCFATFCGGGDGGWRQQVPFFHSYYHFVYHNVSIKFRCPCYCKCMPFYIFSVSIALGMGCSCYRLKFKDSLSMALMGGKFIHERNYFNVACRVWDFNTWIAIE